ncbi:MAG: mannitol dehydrogenase family protein, partial [Actinobacteria bacterium]|nr:mannitol dehydrogenase family protein [Actinomycetota bacterium]
MTTLISPYQRVGRDIGVIHFGLGAFHRGHQAVYFDDALRNGLGEWGSYGISPRSASVTDILRKQQFLYTVNARQGEQQDPRVIGSIFSGSVFDIDNPELNSALISPELKLITITVTEKAYVSGIEGASMPNRI